jgi:hypothetical protein
MVVKPRNYDGVDVQFGWEKSEIKNATEFRWGDLWGRVMVQDIRKK